jgi:hypothetical protein
MIFRLYHETKGGHVHCKLFSGKGEGALGQCGAWVMRVEEFEQFALLVRYTIQFVPPPSATFLDPVWAVGVAMGMIGAGWYLGHLQETPAGWNAKISDKIDDRLSGEVFEEQTPAGAIMKALEAIVHASNERAADEGRRVELMQQPVDPALLPHFDDPEEGDF